MRKIKKLVRLLFVFNLLILFSCQTEEEVLKTTNSQNREFVKRKISLSEINSNKISNQISKAENLKNETITSRLANDSINDFYIETENGLYVQDEDGTESYTFAVYRDSSTINVENLVIMSYPDQEVKTFLVNYNKSIEELNSMTESEILNHTITFNQIDFETNTITTLNTSDPNARWICLDFFKWDVIPCHQGELFGDGPLYCYGWVFSYTICLPGGGGGGGGSGSGGSGYGGNNHGGGGSGGSNTGTGNNNTGNGGVLTIPLSVEEIQAKLAKIKRIKAFKVDLDWDQSTWLNELVNIDAKNSIYDYLESQISSPIVETYPQEAIEFVEELIDLALLDSNTDSNAIGFLLQAKQQDKMASELDSAFFQSVNEYLAIDTSAVDPIVMAQLGTYFTTKCAVLRFNHPSWSNLKIYWEASKDLVHIALDAFGMVPVVGEIADLTNGALYLIEGDGVNATLSFAATVPLAGWSATGAKYAIKIVDATQTATTIITKVKLTWKVLSNGIIDFGYSNQLRKVLGLTDTAFQAHHIMPWTDLIKNHSIIQKAAKSGSAFHMNEALNGIAVASWRNQPNHFTYTNLIKSKLDAFQLANPNATPQQCYNFVSNLIQQIRTWVISHPNSHLNDLVLP